MKISVQEVLPRGGKLPLGEKGRKGADYKGERKREDGDTEYMEIYDSIRDIPLFRGGHDTVLCFRPVSEAHATSM